MKFTIKDLISEVLKSELDEEQKVSLLEIISTTGRITNGLYLKKDNEGNVECWFRNIDENGMTDHGPTNYGPEQIVAEYALSVGKGKSK